ncbi:hypothetical protein ACIQVT_02625 [Streptomyces sp. NPDC100445]|uniref:hypothetical protein n=1 Tax=Streptomyces sp. NPDC100445 TaxID=3366102 RepID=UPI0037F62FEB
MFVCVHDAGRSRMAAAWLAHLAGDRVEVRSAGSAPATEVNPAAGTGHGRGRHLNWKLDDPAGRGVEAARPIRDGIRKPVEDLIGEIAPPGRRTGP